MKSSMLKYKWMCVAVFCCAMFAACEPTEVASDQNPISFNNGPARAQQVPASAANARIWAYYTKTNETTPNWVWTGENAKLDIGTTTDDDGNFNGTFTVNGNTKYWDNGTYNFYSIYSEDFEGKGNIATYEGNELTFTYSIANQKELRLATATVSATKTYGEAVPFQFNHLLSKIKFQGFSTDATQEVTLKTITLSSVAHTATYTIAADGAVSLTLSEDDTDIQPLSSTLTDQANWVMEKVVFPQTIGENQIEFKVTYDEDKDKSAFLPPTEWEAGKSYLYKFYIQPSGPIIFDVVKVEPWVNVSNELTFDVES
jgi:hypothetical protein